MSFIDLFSKQSSAYAAFRPTYPEALYEFLLSLVSERNMVWDVGCGNGQASVALSRYFKNVWATDASREQIEQATKRSNITYRALPAHQSQLPDASCDLVTVAQAAHWFPHDLFFSEVRRVLKPQGIVALWVYERDWNISPEVDLCLRRFSNEILKDYWAPEIRHVMSHYQSIAFPFPEIKAPPLAIHATWSLSDVVGYLASWSATQKYLEIEGDNPLLQIADSLERAWGDPHEKKHVEWGIYCRIGRHDVR